MNFQLKLRRIGTVLAAASGLWFATALTAVADSPVERFNLSVDGYYYPLPLPLDPATGLGWYAFVEFSDTRNDFIRTNPDGSLWIHFQAVKAYLFIGLWDGVAFANINDHPLFVGSGTVNGSFTTPDGWMPDLRRFEWRWEATLTDTGTHQKYPFFLHVVAKDGAFLRDDARFAPLGLGD